MTYRDPSDQSPGTRAHTRPLGAPRPDEVYRPWPAEPQPPREPAGTEQWATEQATPPPPPAPPRPPRIPAPSINPLLFCGGVVMTGVVSGLAAWLVAWILRTIADRVTRTGAVGEWVALVQTEIWFAVLGFVCALLAAALWYVLQLITPAPNSFFRWIVMLLLVASVLVPILVATDNVVAGICTAAVHVVIGLPILALIPMVGRQSMRR